MRIMCLLLLLPIESASLQTRPSARHVTAVADASQSDEAPKTQGGRVLVRGSQQFSEIELCRLIGGVSNNPLESESRKSVEEEVLKEYYRRGFLDAGLRWSEAEKTADDASAPDVIVDVTEGPVYQLRRLEMIGNQNTHDRVIRRRVALQEGAVFDEQLLELSIKRINQLGIFEDFTRGDVEVTANKRGHFVDLVFRLREKP